VNKSQKTEAVTQLNQVFEENEIVVVCQYKGLTVAEITDFRSKLRAEGANFKVTKNRLARLALKGTRYEGLDSHS
jgi:large subunit ribosomal protein L10